MATCDTFLLVRHSVCTDSSLSSAEHLSLSTCVDGALTDACAKMHGKELCIPHLLSLHPDALFSRPSLGQDVKPVPS